MNTVDEPSIPESAILEKLSESVLFRHAKQRPPRHLFNPYLLRDPEST